MAEMAQRQKHLAMSQASWAAAHAVTASLKSSFLPSAEADCPKESRSSKGEQGWIWLP